MRYQSIQTGLHSLRATVLFNKQMSTSIVRLHSSELLASSDLHKPMIGRTVAEQELLYLEPPDMPENPKLLKTSILGAPNAGKSTLVNRIMNKRVSAVSSKINTTRNRTNAVLTDRDTQMIILDTPGLVTFKKSKKFNLERQMIIDPHSALWESDLIVVVHDVSNEYSRDKLDSEVLKCLFAHPDKETILVLNKTDRLKNKSQLLDLVASLTGGRLNGKEFMTKKRVNRNKYTRNSLRDEEYEELFARTADKLNIHLPETKKGKKHEKVLALLDELKTCEEYLMKNQDRISLNGVDSQEIVVQDQNSQLLVQDHQRMTIEKLSQDYVPDKLTPSPTNHVSNQNMQISLINSITSNSEPSQAPALRRIEDISAVDFKKDLLETTDWHMYYKKLNSLSLLVSGKTYWPYFNQVFMVSAKHNDGVNDLKRYLFTRAKPGKWIFTRNMLTDQMPQEMAEMCVREKMLENMSDEIPYEIGLEIAHWEIDINDCLNIAINIIPGYSKYKYNRHMDALFKNSGKLLQYITRESLDEMKKVFDCEINLKLIVITHSPK